MFNKILPSSFKRQIKLAIHSGKKYHCPLCAYRSKDLYAIGLDVPVLKEFNVIGAGRRNAGCYRCNSTDRERLVFTYLKFEFKLFENRNIKILHLAPEANISSLLNEKEFQNYHCGDLYTEGYQYPKYVQNMNVLDIPFGNNYFDLIICNHLLEHVPDDIAAMKEIYRTLNENGKGILQVPISMSSNTTIEDFSITDPKEREFAFGQFDHVRIYGMDYFEKLNSVGFKIDRLNLSEKYPKFGLDPKEELFLVNKGTS